MEEEEKMNEEMNNDDITKDINSNATKNEEINETSSDKKDLIFFQNKTKDLEDKMLRAQAEFQNYKRRREEELTVMFKYINADIIEDILPVIDNIERALSVEISDNASKLQEGIRIIYNSFLDILKKYEVKEIEAFNKPFDPNIHQAISTDNNNDLDDGIVTAVLQKGYMLKDKVIRPAMVKVNKKEREE